MRGQAPRARLPLSLHDGFSQGVLRRTAPPRWSVTRCLRCTGEPCLRTCDSLSGTANSVHATIRGMTSICCHAEHCNAGYILLDLDYAAPDVLPRMRANGHEPCVMLQTSPGDLQAGIRVSTIPLEPAFEVPGVGTLVATAMVASVGNGSAFAKGRDSQLGSDWFPGNSRQGGNRTCSVSANAAITISENYSSMAHDRWWRMHTAKTTSSALGSDNWN
jgi:hypothetical protein